MTATNATPQIPMTSNPQVMSCGELPGPIRSAVDRNVTASFRLRMKRMNMPIARKRCYEVIDVNFHDVYWFMSHVIVVITGGQKTDNYWQSIAVPSQKS